MPEGGGNKSTAPKGTSKQVARRERTVSSYEEE